MPLNMSWVQRVLGMERYRLAVDGITCNARNENRDSPLHPHSDYTTIELKVMIGAKNNHIRGSVRPIVRLA
jgi:hypothetical protein